MLGLLFLSLPTIVRERGRYAQLFCPPMTDSLVTIPLKTVEYDP